MSKTRKAARIATFVVTTPFALIGFIAGLVYASVGAGFEMTGDFIDWL